LNKVLALLISAVSSLFDDADNGTVNDAASTAQNIADTHTHFFD
jgi:hypothetical protein